MAEARYLVTIEGQYYGMENGHKAKKFYSIEVKMTEGMMEKPLSIIKNQVLPIMLPKKYPDYKRYRTYQMVRVIDLKSDGGKVSKVELMGYEQLIDYIKFHELPIEYELYLTTNELRGAILRQKNDEEGFKVEQEKRREALSEQISTQTDLAELNEDLDLGGENLTSPTFNPEALSPAKTAETQDPSIPEKNPEADADDL